MDEDGSKRELVVGVNDEIMKDPAFASGGTRSVARADVLQACARPRSAPRRRRAWRRPSRRRPATARRRGGDGSGARQSAATDPPGLQDTPPRRQPHPRTPTAPVVSMACAGASRAIGPAGLARSRITRDGTFPYALESAAKRQK